MDFLLRPGCLVMDPGMLLGIRKRAEGQFPASAVAGVVSLVAIKFPFAALRAERLPGCPVRTTMSGPRIHW